MVDAVLSIVTTVLGHIWCPHPYAQPHAFTPLQTSWSPLLSSFSFQAPDQPVRPFVTVHELYMISLQATFPSTQSK